MKYVIFKEKEGKHNFVIPVIIPEHCVHSSVSIEGFQPVSAGFVTLENGELSIGEKGSESLNLNPCRPDAVVLGRLLRSFGTAFFEDDGNFYQLKK